MPEHVLRLDTQELKDIKKALAMVSSYYGQAQAAEGMPEKKAKKYKRLAIRYEKLNQDINC